MCSHYLASLWKNSDKSLPIELDPCEYGWCLIDGQLRVKWFDGLQIPENISTVIDEESLSTTPASDTDDEIGIWLSDDDSDSDID